MKEQSPFSYLWVFAAILAVVAIQALSSSEAPGGIPYSEFKRLLAEGRVVDLTVETTTIRGTLKEPGQAKGPGKPFTTVRVDDPGLTRELQERGVTFRGTGHPAWLRDVITVWILPLLVVLLV